MAVSSEPWPYVFQEFFFNHHISPQNDTFKCGKMWLKVAQCVRKKYIFKHFIIPLTATWGKVAESVKMRVAPMIKCVWPVTQCGSKQHIGELHEAVGFGNFTQNHVKAIYKPYIFSKIILRNNLTKFWTKLLSFKKCFLIRRIQCE